MTTQPPKQGGSSPGDATVRARAPRVPWMQLRKDLPAGRSRLLLVLAFVLPLALWSAVSYIPIFWHPLVLITDAGDESVPGTLDYLAPDMLVERGDVAARNAELRAAGAGPESLVKGVRKNPVYLPAPHEVARAFYTAFKTPPARQGDLWLHESLLHSCRIIFWGFFLSMLIGLPLGILCGTFAFFSRLLEPFVDFVRYMPAPVFGALAVAIWGLADAPKIAVIFIGTFFQMVLVVAGTTRQVDGALLEAAQTLGCTRLQLLRHVVIPAALPGLYRDMRILLGWAWTYLVVAELIGAKSGISAFLYQAQRYKQFDNVYAAMLMIGLIGLFIDQILAFIGRHIFPWQKRSEGKAPVAKKPKGLFGGVNPRSRPFSGAEQGEAQAAGVTGPLTAPGGSLS
jgi:NitT/TauT family transport system permease protein